MDHRDCLRQRNKEETVTEVPEVAPVLIPPAMLPRTQIIERARHRCEDIHRLHQWLEQYGHGLPQSVRVCSRPDDEAAR
ncbi:hypothetical protein [Streptomyces griseus]|uniref:hypothetical protein n=1 Tax=Streptomyces griseus TaxID=1911 RepID=UPI00131D31FB|nr:hypothetical protein [Streptomyces griseus]